MISSLVLAVLAFLLSWVWWGTFIISIIAVTLSQLAWCMRLGSHSMYAPFAVMVVTFLASLGTGIYFFVALKKTTWCSAFVIMADDDDYHFDYYHDDFLLHLHFDDDFFHHHEGNEEDLANWILSNATLSETDFMSFLEEKGHLGDRSLRSDWCAEKLWGGIAVASSALWLASSVCILVFLKSGRHAKWEEMHREEANSNNNDTSGNVVVELAEATAPQETGGESIVATASVLEEDVGTKVDETEESVLGDDVATKIGEV